MIGERTAPAAQPLPVYGAGSEPQVWHVFCRVQGAPGGGATGLSFEVESDFWDWEMALDGIETVETMLAELRGNGGVVWL